MIEDFYFVRQCIITSRNEWQLECCRTLINLFVTKHWYESGMADDFFSLAHTWKEQFSKLPN